MIKRVTHRIKKLSEAVALLSAELVLVLLVFLIALIFLIILIRQVFYHKKDTLDDILFSFLSHHVTHAHTVVMQWFTVFGSHFFLIPAWLVLFAFFLFIKKEKWNFIKAAIIAISNLILLFTLKYFFNRSRPSLPLLKEVPGFSFPSGHAFMSLTFFGVIIYMVYKEVANKWLKWITIIMLTLLIFIIGLSRVYLRLHYASDVLAGYCFGVLSLISLFWMLRQIEKYNAKKIPSSLNISKPGAAPSLTKEG